MILSAFCEISTFRGYYPHFVGIRPIFHIYPFSESDWCITYFPICNLICFSGHASFCLVHFVSWDKLNTNPIQIYVTSFYHFNKI